MDNGFPDNNAAYAAAPELTYAPGQHSIVLRRRLIASPLKQNFRRASANESLSKRAIDLVGSTVLIVAFSPVLAAISLMVRRSGKNVIFKQYRVGRNGQLFACYKFRTMVPNAEQLLTQVLEKHPALKEEWASTQKLRNDPRVTRIGAFLRKTSLDELPQLFNVWKGEMSLVGPRPVVQNEMIRYGRAARWYLCSRPGMTGLWQVSGRNDVDYRRRVALDTYYVQNQSFTLDISILLRTIRVVINKDGSY